MLLFALLTGCAPPPIDACPAEGMLVAPAFLTIGNNDLMVASMLYSGCEPFQFSLCGTQPEFVTETEAFLGVWHDGTRTGCGEEFAEDVTLNLGPVRALWEDLTGEDSGDIDLVFGDTRVSYSF